MICASDVRDKMARRKALLATADGILKTGETENRSLTPAELKDFDGVTAKIDLIDAEIKGIEVEMRGTNPGFTGLYSGETGLPITGPSSGMAPGKGRTYRQMFGGEERSVALGTDGFQNFDAFLRAVHSGLHHPQLKPITEVRAMGEGTGSGGGFLVPEEYSSRLLDGALESELVRPRATVYPMLSATRNVPGFDGGDHTSGLFGGFTGTWLAESGTATEVDAKIRRIVLNAKKLACYTRVSNELIADGLNFEQTLGSALTQAIGWYLDFAFLQGSGAGQPLGLLHDPALIVVAEENGQAHNSIVYENLTKMYARLHPACLNSTSCVWIANSTCVPQLMKVSIVTGTAGVHYPVLREDSGRFYIFGKQVLLTEKLPALGLQADLLLTDLSQYAIGLRKEVSLERSNAPGWLQDQTAYRSIVRCDGMGTWSAAVTPKNGDSLSWVVALGARP